ncbi:hypothetical protein RintRC_0056 [Richelia intracellularis]|nr:hypothetical protein RintRC_0056 [Richelia intracellularis]
MNPLGDNWVAKLRTLPAVLGILTIPVMYGTNRLAFSRIAGLMAAVVMAVSPFAVYLSQEARHYTLPMVLISLSLWILLQIQKDIFHRKKLNIGVWLAWVGVHTISLYVHYFCILALIPVTGTLVLIMWWYRQKIFQPIRVWLGLILANLGIAIAFLP